MNAVVILPARNEAECIEQVVADVRAHFDGEVIVVDNGSVDDSTMIATRAGATVIRHPAPGYGGACMAGVAARTEADVYVFMDADGSDCTEDIPLLLAAIENGAEIAVGVRRGPRVQSGSIAPAARFGNWFSGRIMGVAVGRSLADLSPLKAVRRETLQSLAPTEMTYGWTVELLGKAVARGVCISEVETGYRHRRGGKSKVSGTITGSFKAGYRILWVLGKVIMRESSWRAKGGVIGAFVALAATAAYAAWLYTQAPASPRVLVSAWLLAWPALFGGTLTGMTLGWLASRHSLNREYAR